MTQQEFFNQYQYKASTDKLGGGSFGKVYKAYDTVLDKYVAVKVAEQIEVQGKTFSLLDEFKALENLPDHVNIAKYEKFFTFEAPQGVFDYAIMQYYPDGNLSQLIEDHHLTDEQKENLALQLLNGIGFLHQYNVVHRDMKPSNILIHNRTLNGRKEYIPKITDFGLSKKADTGKNTHFTNSFAAGTYAYSSPEQLKGEVLRFNTDIWSYGAIVYEIFTGKTMFNIEKNTSGSSALDVKEILDNILKSDISAKIAELPQKWQPVVLACLERDAGKRVKNTKEIFAIFTEKETKETISETVLIEKKIPKTVIIDKPENVFNVTETFVLKNKNNLKLWVGSFAVLGLFAIGAFFFNNTKKTESTNNFEIEYTKTKVPVIPENYEIQMQEFSQSKLSKYLAKKENDTIYVSYFFTTWCNPCIGEIPFYIEKMNELEDQPVKFTFINLDAKEDWNNIVKEFAKKNNIEKNIVLINPEELNTSFFTNNFKNWDGGTLPFTIIKKANKSEEFSAITSKENLSNKINNLE